MGKKYNWEWLALAEMAGLTGKHRVSVTQRAERQGWPVQVETDRPGSPRKFFRIWSLPDDIQTAWAEHAELNRQQITEALNWPLRTTYFAGRKQYNGTSIGLCSPAQTILRDRLVKLPAGDIAESEANPKEISLQLVEQFLEDTDLDDVAYDEIIQIIDRKRNRQPKTKSTA